MRHHGPSCLDGPRSALLRRLGQRASVNENRTRILPSPTPGSRTENRLREELVRQVRAQLAAGTYLTAKKWEAALDNLAGYLEAGQD